MSRSLVSLPPVPMGAVAVSGFRVTGFVVPVHVKSNRAASAAIHFADPSWGESKSGSNAPWWSRLPGSLTPRPAFFTGGRTTDLKRASRLKPGGFERRHNAP